MESPPLDPPIKPRDIAKYLESLTSLCFDVFNERDYACTTPAGTIVRRHHAHDYKAHVGLLNLDGMTFDELMTRLATFLEHSPRALFKPMSIVATVDESKQSAVVSTQVVMYGWQSDTEIKAFAQHSWRLEKGEWKIWLFESVRSGEIDDGAWR